MENVCPEPNLVIRAGARMGGWGRGWVGVREGEG